MYRIYLQNGLIVGKESMTHLDPLVPDSWLDGIDLPAAPVYTDGVLTGIANLEYIPYTVDKNPITTVEEATITALTDVIAIVDGVEYPPEADGIISYSNANVGTYEITLKKHGYKNTVINVEVVEGA